MPTCWQLKNRFNRRLAPPFKPSPWLSPATRTGKPIACCLAPVALSDRFRKSTDRFFPAASRRTVGNDRDLLDAGLFDALDLRAAFVDGSGDRELFHEPVGNHFGVIRLLIHVMVVVVGFADICENLLLLRIEDVRKR